MHAGFMKYATLVLIGAAALGLAACSERHERVRSVEELLDEPAILDGVVVRCNAHMDHAKRDRECINAWAAVERRGQKDDAQQAPKREEQFERSREKVRLAIEQRDAAKREVPYDPYRAPVVQDPATAPGASQP